MHSCLSAPVVAKLVILFLLARVNFTAQNESTTSIKVTWDNNLPDFVIARPNEPTGFLVDFYKEGAEASKVTSITFCNTTSSHVFSNLSIYTNYCYNVVAFDSETLITKLQNLKCAFTDEIGKTQ